MSAVATRRTKLPERPARPPGTCAAHDSAAAAPADAPRISRSALKAGHSASMADSADRAACIPSRRFAALPITALHTAVPSSRKLPSCNSENEDPAVADSVQKRALPKRSCTQVSAPSSAARVVASAPKPPKPAAASSLHPSSSDFQNPKRRQRLQVPAPRTPAVADRLSSAAAAPPNVPAHGAQASCCEGGQNTLEQFGFPVVNFMPKSADVEIVDRSRDSTLALYGFSEPKFKPKAHSADAAAPLVQSDILKFCVPSAQSSLVDVEDSPEHSLACAGGTPPTASRKSTCNASQSGDDALSIAASAAPAPAPAPAAKRVRKPDTSPETLDEHRRLIYHQLRTPAMVHEDAQSGKLVFRCAGHIVRHFAANCAGGLKGLAKKMGLDYNRLHDKSLFWKLKFQPLFCSDITQVLRLGAPEGVRPCFAFDGFVYPVGFISRFVYTNFEDHLTDIFYQFGIVDCKLFPLFYMISETYDVARYYHVATSPAELWEAFEKFLHAKFDEPIREAAYEEIFGYGLPDVVAEIAQDSDGESLKFMAEYAVQLKNHTRTHTLQELDEDEWLDDSKHAFYMNSGKASAPRELSAHQKAVMRSRQQKKAETDSEDDDPVELRVAAGEFLWHGKPGFCIEDMTLKFRRPVLEQFTGCKIKEQDVLDVDLPIAAPEPARICSKKSKKRRRTAPAAAAKKLEFIRELPRVLAQALKVGAALPMNSSGSAKTQPYVPMTFLQKLPFITIAEQHLPPELSSSMRYSKISDTERYKLMRQYLHSTLAVGLSSIHGRGLFLLHPVMQHQMLIEYTGELIRPQLADIRERRYMQAEGLDSFYFFRVDDCWIVDATKKHNQAHCINHSCDPNCYAKILTIDGKKKIIIYAQYNLQKGTELTYDYKLNAEEEKLKCYCGAANCRGWMN